MPIEVDIAHSGVMKPKAKAKTAVVDALDYIQPPAPPVQHMLIEPYHGGPYVLPVLFHEAWWQFDGSPRASAPMWRDGVGGLRYRPEVGTLEARISDAMEVFTERCRIVYHMSPKEAAIALRYWMLDVESFIERWATVLGSDQQAAIRVRW